MYMFRTEEEKRNLVAMHLNGVPVSSLCEEFGICKSTLYNWIRDYSPVKTRSGANTCRRSLYFLEMQIKKLTLENEIWRRSDCSINSPLQKKLEAVFNLYQEYGVHPVCDTLEVRRSTFYYYQRRRPKQVWYKKEDAILRPVIQKVFKESKGRLGAKKICAILKQRGYITSPKKVTRLMKEMGLVYIAARKMRKRPMGESNPFLKNELKQQFKQREPVRVWVSDITCIFVNNVRHYLCVIIDLFSRKVLAYRISNRESADIVAVPFKQALEQRGYPTNQMFHSDQGLQCTSYEFTQLLRASHVAQSFSAPGYPYDNAVAESFFSAMKREEVYREQYQNIMQLQEAVDEYIGFFNNKRPHQNFGYLTPTQVEEKFRDVNKEHL